jgi:hypothetical protein
MLNQIGKIVSVYLTRQRLAVVFAHDAAGRTFFTSAGNP